MEFILTFTPAQIKPAKKTALEKLSRNMTLKGFRPGKAPLDLVEKHLDPQQLIEETAASLIPSAYSQYVIEHKLQPITQPKITLKDISPEGNWEFDVEIAERPEVKLNKYQDAVKTATAKEAIWTPGKDDKPTDEQEKNSKKLNLILDTLLKTAKIDIPNLLVEQEVNHSLSHLLEQVEKLGLKLDQYLTSVGKTAEQLRQEYRKASEDNLKLEFILDAIAKDQKFDISKEEVDKILEKTDPKTAKIVEQNPNELASLKYSLIKQKVIAFLMSL